MNNLTRHVLPWPTASDQSVVSRTATGGERGFSPFQTSVWTEGVGGWGGREGSEQQEKCDRFQASAEEREERNGVKQQMSPSF